VDIDSVIGQLTLEEKAALVIGGDFWHTATIERLSVPAVMMSDGPHGMRTQKQADAQDQAGIGGSEPATCFPTACNIHASWDPEVVKKVGAAIAREAKALGVSVVLGPGVNIKRSPLCGRNFEYVSEDPYLAGIMGAAMVEGIQSENIGTSVKHFAANNQETDRLRVNAEVDERSLREIYLPAFEHIVKTQQPWTIMCSYNTLNGSRVSENKWLLTEVLRDQWGFEGLVVSDWGAVANRVPAVQAGLDLEMPPAFGRSDKAVVEAVNAGQLSMDDLDTCVRRVLELVERGSYVGQGQGEVDFAANHALAREAAAQGCVLLKNDGTLPLASGAKVAVVGEFARTSRFQGGGSSEVNTTQVDKALDAFAEAFGGEVPFAPGYAFEGDGSGLVDEAVAVAKDADVVVFFMGLTDAEESEGFDRATMDLPANQLAALDAVVAANPKTVVVLMNGSLVTMRPWDAKPVAILEAWLGGQAIGGAVVDVLTGKVNPAGRLNETIPERLEDNSSFGNFPGDSGVVRYGEGLLVGYRGYDYKQQEVAYPFGFGLSYTTFSLANLTVTSTGSAEAGDLSATVTLDVTNTGDVAGADVVQVYVRDVESSVLRPVRELKGFAKVSLEPGETKTVSIELDQRAFSFWSELTHEFVVEGGEFVIEVGENSRDLPLSASISVEAPRIAKPLSFDSSAEEWVADPKGRALLIERYGQDGKLPGLLGNDHMMTVIGNFPLERMVSFGSMLPFGWDEFQQLLQDVQRP